MRSEESVYDVNISQTKMLEEGLYTRHQNDDELNYQILKSYKLSKSIKIFSFIDTVLNLFYVFFNPWYLIPSLISIIGYIGALKYISKCLYVYFVYQVIFMIIRMSIGINSWGLNDYGTGELIINVILTIILTIFDIYISRFTYKLIRSLMSLDSMEILKLQNIKELKTNFLYW